MKTKVKNSHEPVDKQHYEAAERFQFRNPSGTAKKKYLLREIEREEAEKEIFIAKRKQLTNDPSEVSEVQRMDETKIYKQ